VDIRWNSCCKATLCHASASAQSAPQTWVRQVQRQRAGCVQQRLEIDQVLGAHCDTEKQTCSVFTWLIVCSAVPRMRGQIQRQAIQLRLLLGHERKQTDDFEAYLERALTESDHERPSIANSCGLTTQETVCSSNDTHCSLSEQISRLQDTVMSEREANRLFELQLLQICLCAQILYW